MFTLMAIVILVLFLKVIGFVFCAGLRIPGWLFSGISFILSVILAMPMVGLWYQVP